MKDAALTKCTKCGNDSLVRLIGSGGGMIFKGSGFYQTDYKGGGTAKKESSPTTEKKTETKPASDAKHPSDTPTTSSPAKKE